MPESSTPREKTLQQLTRCLRVLDDKKATDVQVIEVGELSSLTDFVVLATATSEPHLRALRGELAKTVKEAGIPLVGADYSEQSGWLVVDAFDFMVHVFLPAMRESYRLEGMWRTAPHLDVEALLGQSPKPAPKTKRTRAPKPKSAAAPKKTAPRKTASTKAAAKKKRASAKTTPAKHK